MSWCLRNYFLITLAFIFAITSSAQSQNSSGPQPAPLPHPIPAPVDKPYPGTLALSVDLTNVNDRILPIRETIPVKPGEVTLLYPQWLPGTHSPSNAITNLAGLVITANGKAIPWMRDRICGFRKSTAS